MTNKGILGVVVLIIIIILGFWFMNNKSDMNEGGVAVTPTPVTPSPVNPPIDPIGGCYVAKLGNDVYTLKVETQSGADVTGKLSFKNYQKDSSSGTFSGTYKDGILLGDYSFRSEGMDSLMQVIFKKSGSTFVRGFGPVDSTGTKFTDLSKITYDSNQTFVFTQSCLII